MPEKPTITPANGKTYPLFQQQGRHDDGEERSSVAQCGGVGERNRYQRQIVEVHPTGTGKAANQMAENIFGLDTGQHVALNF